MRIFGGITKIEEQDDGSLKVFGVASSGCRDDAGEIVTPDAMKGALPDYALYPALREMHQPSAAGRTLEAEVDADGFTRIVAHVVDPVAIAKVKSKTYAGFSIGGKVLQRDTADRTIITAIKLSEISLVDRPANPEASIDLWKADLGELTPMADYTPTNDEVKARAGDMAKAAGKPDRAKDFLVKAREALVAEHDAPAVVEAVGAPVYDPAIVEAVDKAAGGLTPEVRADVLAKVAADASGEDLDDIVTKAIAEFQAAREPVEEPDAAAVLAAAIAKAKEADKPVEAAVSPLDLVKTAAALRLVLAASEGKLTKGLWSVARLCEIIEALTWLQQDTTWEAAGENDGSTIPADIATHIAGLLSCLQSMVSEEAAEIVEAYQDQGMDIDLDVTGGDAVIIEAATSILDLAKADEVLMAKVGARHSKADATNIQAAHDALAKLGAMCDPDNTPADEADKAAKLAKAAFLDEKALEAAAALTKQSADLADLRKHAAGEADRTAAAIDGALAKFRKEPLPPKTAASTHAAIGKPDDATPGADGPDDVQKAELTAWWAGLTPEQRALEAMKSTFRSPVQAR